MLKANYKIGPEIYLGRDVSKQLSGIHNLIDHQLIPKINLDSTILESGCNTANLLWKLKAEFHCNIVGVDNNSESLAVAKNIACNGDRRAKFIVADVLDTDVFDL